MKLDSQKLKYIGGAIIVLAAFSLMFNEVFSYLAGLGRMLTLILVALIIAAIVATILRKVRPSKTSSGSGSDSDSNTDTNKPENLQGE